jgi:hypothetical protein
MPTSAKTPDRQSNRYPRDIQVDPHVLIKHALAPLGGAAKAGPALEQLHRDLAIVVSAEAPAFITVEVVTADGGYTAA